VVDGDTFADFQSRVCAVLREIPLERYYGFPSPVDGLIGAVAGALTAVSDDQRVAFAAGLEEHDRRLLGRYALRAPVLALHTRDRRPLVDGLRIYTLLPRVSRDVRDDMVAWAPYHYTARQLSVDPVKLFAAGAAWVAGDLAADMQTFARRTDISLGAFGWRLVDTPNGPTLETLDFHHAPTGAVVGSASWDTVNESLVRDLLDWIEKQTGARPVSDG
jgi:hypothetical protein